jgi:IS5 family transposase
MASLQSMKQASLELNLSAKKTRKREFLEQMERVVPWSALVALIAPYYPEDRTGRPPFALETMLRTHFLQQWFSLSDPAMEEAFFDVPLYREFVQLDAHGRLPDESTILRFRHRLEKHKLADGVLATVNDLLSSQGLLLRAGSAVDATLIAAPSSTKNKDKQRDPEMHSSKKGNQWYFGMKAHIGVDADSGLVHTVRGTSGHVADITEGNSLLHGEETDVFADAGYQGAHKRPDAKPGVHWHVAMRPCKRRKLDKDNNPLDALVDKEEKLKAGIRAKVEHPFRVIKRQFGLVKVRYRGLKKNTLQLKTLFALFPPVDEQAQTDRSAGISASRNMTIALNRAKVAQTPTETWPQRPELRAGRLL